MDVFKLNYELRYSKILNFKDVYKEIINPYFIYPNTRYTISNEGNHLEGIRVNFNDSKHSIIFMLDKISFSIDCSMDDIYGENKVNHVDMCFEIYEKVKKLSTFTKFNLEIIEVFFFKESEKENKVLLDDFLSFYNLGFKAEKLTDVAVVLDSEKSEGLTNLQFGLFNPIKDAQTFGLFNLDRLRAIEMENKRGLLLKCGINTSNSSNVSKKSYNKLVEKALTLANELYGSYEPEL